MATNVTSSTHTISTNDDFIIKWAQQNAPVGKPYLLIIDLEDSGSDDGTYTVKARPLGSSGTLRQIPYQSLHLNAAVGTGALVSTNITDDSLIAVLADGLEIAVTRAGGSAGSTVMTLSIARMV